MDSFPSVHCSGTAGVRFGLNGGALRDNPQCPMRSEQRGMGGGGLWLWLVIFSRLHFGVHLDSKWHTWQLLRRDWVSRT